MLYKVSKSCRKYGVVSKQAWSCISKLLATRKLTWQEYRPLNYLKRKVEFYDRILLVIRNEENPSNTFCSECQPTVSLFDKLMKTVINWLTGDLMVYFFQVRKNKFYTLAASRFPQFEAFSRIIDLISCEVELTLLAWVDSVIKSVKIKASNCIYYACVSCKGVQCFVVELYKTKTFIRDGYSGR